MTTEKKGNIKKILSIVGNVLIWAFVVLSVLVTVLVFAAQNSDDGIPELFGKSLITIETPSMEPTYKVGDLVLMNKLTDEEKRNLADGTIITYRAPIDINGDGQRGDINTHRIQSHDKATGLFVTKGDGNDNVDNYRISYNDIIGSCTEKGRVGGVGGVIGFLRSSLGFFLCIVLPLILFFIYELYRFISIFVAERAKKAPVSKETEEEIKRRAIEEYLKQQQGEADAGPDDTAAPLEETSPPEEASTEADKTEE